MCKFHGIDSEVSGGSVDATHGRELLPANVIPRHYDLTLEPDFEKFTYEGTVIIDLDVVEDTKEISINTLELDIKQTSVLVDGKSIRYATFCGVRMVIED